MWAIQTRLLSKMKLQSDMAKKSPRSTAYEERCPPLITATERCENTPTHTSSLTDSKNSPVNLPGKWDSSDCAAAEGWGRKHWDWVLLLITVNWVLPSNCVFTLTTPTNLSNNVLTQAHIHVCSLQACWKKVWSIYQRYSKNITCHIRGVERTGTKGFHTGLLFKDTPYETYGFIHD